MTKRKRIKHKKHQYIKTDPRIVELHRAYNDAVARLRAFDEERNRRNGRPSITTEDN